MAKRKQSLGPILLSAELAFDFEKHGDCQEYLDQYWMLREHGVTNGADDAKAKDLKRKLDALDCLNW